MPAHAAAQPTEVNTCGQVFSGNGFLSGDLDCSAFVGTAITIQGGTLDLQGFTLTAQAPFEVILCTKHCKIVSDPAGGTITTSGPAGASLLGGSSGSLVGPKVNLRISDVFVDNVAVLSILGHVKLVDSTATGIGITNILVNGALDAPKVTLIRSVVTGNSVPGVFGRAKIVDSEVSNNTGAGLTAGRATVKRSMIFGNSAEGIAPTDRVRVTDSSITGNGRAGVDLSIFGKAKILRSDISGNGLQGISGKSKRVVVRDSTINNNGSEGIRQDVFSSVVKITDSTLTGNALDGIAQINTETTECKLTLKGASTITGNGTDPSCGVSRTCADLTSCGLPEVDPTSMCNTSYDAASGFPGVSWGVCALD